LADIALANIALANDSLAGVVLPENKQPDINQQEQLHPPHSYTITSIR